MVNVWDYVGKVNAICVTTNGFVKSNGRCVMGRGIALSARETFNDIDLELGKLILKYGNICQIIRYEKGTAVVSFPVKKDKEIMSEKTQLVSHMLGRFKEGDVVPGWSLKAELSIIEKSAKELLNLINTYNWKSVIMTKPGCFNGGLDWSDVKPKITRILGSHVIVI